jgi:hypothetical protein
MAELLRSILLLIGLLANHVVEGGDLCPTGPCPDVPNRPVVAWTATQSPRADEITLWTRGERRPGQPGPVVRLERGPHARLVVGPATERLLVLRLRATPR